MRDVAETSGVAQSVVSEVLAGKHRRYRQETIKRVIETARRLGYRPNHSARAMRRGRFNNLTLLMSSSSSFLMAGLLEGIHEAVNAAHQHLSVAAVGSAQLNLAQSIPHCLRELSSDGVIINYWVTIPPEVINLIHQSGWPCVWINLKQDADCVYPDDWEGGKRAARMLLELGHRRIAYMNYTSWLSNAHYSSLERRAGYEAAMREAGLEPLVFDGHPLPQPDQLPAIKAVLQHYQPTAIITYGDNEIPAVQHAAAELGWTIPRDLSLVTFQALWPEHLKVLQTMMTIPAYAMGKTAVEILLRKIERPEQLLPPIAVPCGFHPGHTCAPPRGQRQAASGGQ